MWGIRRNVVKGEAALVSLRVHSMERGQWKQGRCTWNKDRILVTLETSHALTSELKTIAFCPHTRWDVSRVERWQGPEARPGILSGKNALAETDRKCARSQLDATRICKAFAAML